MRTCLLLIAAALAGCAATPTAAPPSALNLGSVDIGDTQAAGIDGCGSVLWRPYGSPSRWLMADDYEKGLIRIDGVLVTVVSRPALAPVSPDASHRVFLDATGTVRVDQRLTRGRVIGDEVWEVAGTLSVTRGADRVVVPVDGEEGC